MDSKIDFKTLETFLRHVKLDCDLLTNLFSVALRAKKDYVEWIGCGLQYEEHGGDHALVFFINKRIDEFLELHEIDGVVFKQPTFIGTTLYNDKRKPLFLVLAGCNTTTKYRYSTLIPLEVDEFKNLVEWVNNVYKKGTNE